MRAENIIIGCCGFPVAIDKYVKVMNAVETQQTFYKLIPETTAQHWWEQATTLKPEFQFTVKASQFITHRPGRTYAKAGIVIPEEKKLNYGNFNLTEEVLSAWEHTVKIARKLHARAILLQSPPSFHETSKTLENVRNFLEKIKTNEFLLFWEPRGKWNNETLKTICEEFEIYECTDPMIKKPVSSKYYYFRLHGGVKYQHVYTEVELEKLAAEIKALDGEKAYVFFNNKNMYQDAQKFQMLIK